MLVRQIAYRIYEKSMIKNLSSGPIPGYIALVISDGDLMDQQPIYKLLNFIRWCSELGVKEVSVYVSVTYHKLDAINSRLTGCISGAFKGSGFKCRIVSPGSIIEHDGSDPCMVNISIGYGGKYEVVNALREIMQEVKAGKINEEDIDESLIESHLMFKSEPDLFIRTGEARLTDFLIWQSVYSELYFTDVNWEDFRKVDLLRAIRDYQYRQRRFGK